MPCPSELTAKIPPRAPDALGGTAFIERIAGLETGEREAAIVAEILSGNIPDFLRKLVPIKVTGTQSPDGGEGTAVSATLCVMPDYLAIGSDGDFVHMPMNLRSSTRIARQLGFILPTYKIVDVVHEQAAYKYSPQPMRPGPQMVLPNYFLAHESRISAQRSRDGAPMGVLVAGHKKDVVLSNVLNQRRGRIAIYGWHYPDGTPIQPLSTAHHAAYADYSHGIRLVSQIVMLDGQPCSVYDVLQDEQRAELLSAEGVIRNLRALMGRPAT
jgi:hypothetical protein